MKYSVYDTGKIGKIYKSAREGVQEWSERPLKITWEAQITFFAARSKIEFASFFVREGDAFNSEACDVGSQ